MKLLYRYLEDPFNDDNVSANNMASFTTDSIQRMIANNPGGVLNARIAATSTAFDAFDASITDDTVRKAVRKNRKQAKNDTKASLPLAVKNILVKVEAKLGANTPVLVEFCPDPPSAFTRYRDDEVDNKLGVIVAGAEANLAQTGQEVLDEAQQLLATWMAVYNASEESTGAQTVTIEQKRAARAALNAELFENLRVFMGMFPANRKSSAYICNKASSTAAPDTPDLEQEVELEPTAMMKKKGNRVLRVKAWSPRR